MQSSRKARPIDSVLDIPQATSKFGYMEQQAHIKQGRHFPLEGIICFLFLANLSTACSGPDPLEKLEQGETGRVVRIIDGDALVLDTGLTVRLVGVEAPAPQRRNRGGQPYADKSARLLEDLSLGRQVRLIYPGITRDRYDRALAYLVTEDSLGPRLWLNAEILRRGGARARLYPDTSALGGILLDAEQSARANGLGLWELSAYDILPAYELPSEARGFYIVTAALGAKQAAIRDGAKCTRQLLGASLVLDIENSAGTLCMDTAPLMPARFRGYVRDGRMEITHKLNVEWLGTDQTGERVSLD